MASQQQVKWMDTNQSELTSNDAPGTSIAVKIGSYGNTSTSILGYIKYSYYVTFRGQASGQWSLNPYLNSLNPKIANQIALFSYLNFCTCLISAQLALRFYNIITKNEVQKCNDKPLTQLVLNHEQPYTHTHGVQWQAQEGRRMLACSAWKRRRRHTTFLVLCFL